eukprot:2569732-Pyramimonas_sp.AAC.1
MPHRVLPGTLLFRHLTLAKLEAIFRKYGDVDGVKITPHCLRHAGPPHDMHYNGASLDFVMMRGRWTVVNSVRRYGKPAKLLRQLAKLERTT